MEEKGEQYPVICLTPEGKAFMKTEEQLIMKLPKEETEKKSESKEKKNRRKKGAVAAELSEKDAELFEAYGNSDVRSHRKKRYRRIWYLQIRHLPVCV